MQPQHTRRSTSAARGLVARLALAASLALALTATGAQAPGALAAAARERDMARVLALLESTADINAPGTDGTPALHWLVQYDEVATAAALLAAGADPNRETRYGLQPLILAAGQGSPDMLAVLAAAGADIEARGRDGETALMAAVDSGRPAAVAQLLALGAQADARDQQYALTALMLAARNGDAEMLEALIAAGADVNAATRIGPEPQWILPNSRAGFGFGVGIIRGGLPADRGMRPFRAGGMTPLLFAAREGHAEIVRRLLDAGASIDLAEANAITPLLLAVSNNELAVAHLLIERGADIEQADFYGRTPLWSAVNVRNLYVHNQTFEHTVEREPVLGLIRRLLEHGADPNPRTTESPPVREHLLAITGTLEWVDFTGQTPFLSAALAGDVTTMRLLLAHGADPHLATYAGTTALMAAAGVNWVVSQTYTEGPAELLEAVQLCVELGLDVNAVNSMGLRAIHGAANRGSDDIIRYLAGLGADLTAADVEGRTPLDWAHGVFLATHPAEPKPGSIALLESLLEQG